MVKLAVMVTRYPIVQHPDKLENDPKSSIEIKGVFSIPAGKREYLYRFNY